MPRSMGKLGIDSDKQALKQKGVRTNSMQEPNDASWFPRFPLVFPLRSPNALTGLTN